MFELIIFIIIITVVMKSKKKNQKTASKPSAVRTQPTPVPRRTQQSRPQQRPAQGAAVQRNVQQSKPAQKNPAKQEEMSTMEMLEAKAQADDREEMLEKQRRRMENKKHYGSHNYAEKYIIGDPVPKGKRMIYCSYCNAENLIPTYSISKDYNCYFCREEL